jgi:hypothetical protein
MAEEIARFQAEVRRLALDIAQTIFRQEFELAPKRQPKRQAELPLPSPKQRKGKPARPSKRGARAAAADAGAGLATAPTADAQTSLPLDAPAASASDAAATPAPAPAPTAAPTTGKRVSWTRESIINELATWMAGGTVIDAAFVRRHGPPGLVAATRRVFGRFEAGLNVAALHVSKLYPDGPPSSRSSGQQG